jgi:hypothetical protein
MNCNAEGPFGRLFLHIHFGLHKRRHLLIIYDELSHMDCNAELSEDGVFHDVYG